MQLTCCLVGGCGTTRDPVQAHTVQSQVFPSETPRNLPKFFQHNFVNFLTTYSRLSPRVWTLHVCTPWPRSYVFPGLELDIDPGPKKRKHAFLRRLERRGCPTGEAHWAGVLSAFQRGGAHFGQEAAECDRQERWKSLSEGWTGATISIYQIRGIGTRRLCVLDIQPH